MITHYWMAGQVVAQETERNYAAAKHRQVWFAELSILFSYDILNSIPVHTTNFEFEDLGAEWRPLIIGFWSRALNFEMPEI